MSLKARLRISIVTLVTMLVLMQCIATLRFTIEDKFKDVQDRAEAIKEQTRFQVQQRVNDQLATHKPAPSGPEETKALVRELVSNDPYLPKIFVSSIIGSRGIVEIQLCDRQGLILASSTKHEGRQTYMSLPLFDDWSKSPLWDRIWEVMISDTHDYAIMVPLGAGAGAILDIRIVVSTVLIRKAIETQVSTLAGFSALSLLAAMALAYLFSNALVNWLNRLSQRIESIATGEFTPPDKANTSKEPKEFADMTSKLEVLSHQFRGAREDMLQLRSNIDGMLERLDEGVILFDAEQKVVRASRSAERILGLSQTEVNGKSIASLFPGSSPLGELLRDVIARPRAVRETAVTLERGEAGSLRLLANVDLVEGPEGAKPGLLLTLRDIESRWQLRTQLDISTRLAAISRLTGGVAHEIKNPLNAMALHLQNLADKLEGEPRVQGELGIIGGEIARLDHVVKTFLDFTRPVELQLETVDIVDLARQVATLVWPGAERGAVSVQLEAKAPKAWARVDKDLVKQALINVVNNGVEAMVEGGRLTIGVDREGDQILVTVADQGPGIPPAIREKIFNLYFTTKKGVGSGIGLARTFQIVQLHNGTVDFSSNPLTGTTFRLRFPAEDVSASEQTVAADATLGVQPAASAAPTTLPKGGQHN